MRKFAANFEGTAYLAEENREYENREKYSGGAGYYLGKSKYYGWIVKKDTFWGSREQTVERYALIAGDEDNICLKAQTDKTETAAETHKGRNCINIQSYVWNGYKIVLTGGGDTLHPHKHIKI